VSAPEISSDVMSHFEALAGGSRLTILLGAGASASVGLPTWDEFSARVAVASGAVPDAVAAELLIEKQDPMMTLEAARESAGDNWATVVRTSLYGDPPDEPANPSSLQLAAADYYFASGGRATLATLNFDTLLESALLSGGAPAVAIALDGESPNLPTVHHLHGLVTRDDVEDEIVSFRDFADLVATEGSWQRRFLSEALAAGPLLLAGTSFRDPDIRQWLHLILRDEAPRNPALVTVVREGLRLSRPEFESISDALVAQWHAIGLTALTLHDLADVALVIRELRHVHDPEYVSPQERARRVWSRHGRRFGELQRRYSAQLASDAELVGRAMGTSAARATLWLADARGKLARWSSEGSLHRTVRGLKRVPVGHDSPWIAGEALGAEEIKLKDVPREQGVSPTWRSVLAVPVFVTDGRHPTFASAVLTFGLGTSAVPLLERQAAWESVVAQLSDQWGNRLREVAFTEPED